MPPSFNNGRLPLLAKDKTFKLMFQGKLGSPATATAEQLIRTMDRLKIKTSIVVGYGWTDPEIAQRSNDYLLESAKRFPGRIVPFCSVNPLWGDAAILEISRCVKSGAIGIGELHPDTQGIELERVDELNNLMMLVESLGVPVLIHASEPVGHRYPGKGTVTPQKLMALITAYPNITFIFAHWGGGLPFYALMPEVKMRLRNVFFDTAATTLLYSQKIFSIIPDILGAEQVLFGSDYPLVDPKDILQQLSSQVDQETYQLISHDNAARLLKEIAVPDPD